MFAICSSVRLTFDPSSERIPERNFLGHLHQILHQGKENVNDLLPVPLLNPFLRDSPAILNRTCWHFYQLFDQLRLAEVGCKTMPWRVILGTSINHSATAGSRSQHCWNSRNSSAIGGTGALSRTTGRTPEEEGAPVAVAQDSGPRAPSPRRPGGKVLSLWSAVLLRTVT